MTWEPRAENWPKGLDTDTVETKSSNQNYQRPPARTPPKLVDDQDNFSFLTTTSNDEDRNLEKGNGRGGESTVEKVAIKNNNKGENVDQDRGVGKSDGKTEGEGIANGKCGGINKEGNKREENEAAAGETDEGKDERKDEGKDDQGKDENKTTAAEEEYKDNQILPNKKALQRTSKIEITQCYASGDLKVIAKRNGDIDGPSFLVSSHTLSMASEMWKVSIYPRPGLHPALAYETKPGGSNFFNVAESIYLGQKIKTMAIAEEDTFVLDIIFRILHFQTDKIPTQISFGLLRRIAVVCNRYGCGKALNPWSQLWMKSYQSYAASPRFEDWIFIAKALHYKDIRSREISRVLVSESSSRSLCGNYFLRDMRLFGSHGQIPGVPVPKAEIYVKYLPEEFLAYVTRERSEAVKTIVMLLRQFVTDLIPNQARPPPKFCRDEACSDIAVGSFIRSLKKTGLWPLLNLGTPCEWHGSVQELVARIEKLEMTTFTRSDSSATSTTRKGLSPEGIASTTSQAPSTSVSSNASDPAPATSTSSSTSGSLLEPTSTTNKSSDNSTIARLFGPTFTFGQSVAGSSNVKPFNPTWPTATPTTGANPFDLFSRPFIKQNNRDYDLHSLWLPDCETNLYRHPAFEGKASTGKSNRKYIHTETSRDHYFPFREKSEHVRIHVHDS
ncbi:hypothetical protein TWF481_010826 [Arthrobotrys musiformis]|uniref:Uncharacterized protein n=1 Tax=Arthrobotrys musiformis TaxID=47236 RepID=A0AAV9W489_9PEZI